jgi:hypothetical protein
MKLRSLVLALFLASISLTACKREEGVGAVSDGTVTFAGSGITLAPGDGWKRIEIAAGPGQCPPTLVGKSEIIQVLLMPPDRSDPQAAVAGLQAAFNANPKALKDSFKQEPFVAEGGLQGVRVSYSQQSEKDGQPSESRSYNYLFKNRGGRVVGVNYVATASGDSETVHQMIRKTLKHQ